MTGCGTGQSMFPVTVLLPASCLPRLGDDAEVVGAVLVAKASGRGSRTIAAELHRPVSTVRRWPRRACGEHVNPLFCRAPPVGLAYRLSAPAGIGP